MNDPNRTEIRMLSDIDVELDPDTPQILETWVADFQGAFSAQSLVDPNRMEIRMLSDIDIEVVPDSPTLETLESLLEECQGASVKSLTTTDSDGSTLLHRLVNKIEDTATDLKNLLLKHSGKDKKDLLTAQDKSKATILHYLAASKNGNQAIAHQTLWSILQESALENNQWQQILMQRNGKGDNILHILAKEAKEDKSLEILEQFIKWYAEAGLKEKLETQGNPLKQAIMNGNTKGAILLMENEYAIMFDKKYGLNALHSCIKYMNSELVEYILLKYPDLRLQLDEKKASPLHYVVDLKGPQDIQKQPDSLRRREMILQNFLESDLTDVDQLNNQNENCLHLGIGSGFPQAATIIIDYLQKPPKLKRSKEGITLSQKLAALLNAKNKDESTPLFLAIHKGFGGVVAKIMQCKELDGDMKDKQYRTALYLAMDLDHVEAFKKIVETIPRGLGNPRKKRRLLCYAGEKSDGTKIFKWLLEKVTHDEVKAQALPPPKNQKRERNQRRQPLKKSSSLPIHSTQDEAKAHELPPSGNETLKIKTKEGKKGKTKKSDSKEVLNSEILLVGHEEILMHSMQDEDKDQELPPSGNETLKKKTKEGKKGKLKETDNKEIFNFEILEDQVESPMHSIARSQAKKSLEKYILLCDRLRIQGDYIRTPYFFLNTMIY